MLHIDIACPEPGFVAYNDNGQIVLLYDGYDIESFIGVCLAEEKLYTDNPKINLSEGLQMMYAIESGIHDSKNEIFL